MTETDRPLLAGFHRKKKDRRFPGKTKRCFLTRSLPRLSFRRAVVLSLLLHGAVFGILVPGWNPLRIFGSTGLGREKGILQRAAAEIGMTAPTTRNSGAAAEKGSTRGFMGDLLRQFSRLDLGDAQKLELWKYLLGEMMSLQGGGETLDPDFRFTPEDLLRIWKGLRNLEMDSGDMVIPAPRPDEFALKFHTLPRDEIDRMREMRRLDELDRDGARIERGRVRVETMDGIRYIPTEYYFRDSEYEAILARGEELFTVVRGFPDLAIGGNGSDRPEVYDNEPGRLEKTGRSFRVIYIRDVGRSEVPVASTGPIPGSALDIYSRKEEVEEVLDGLMALDEHDQFAFFRDRYLDVYDPEQGDLPRLTRDFVYNNLCNIIIVFNPVSGAFGFLEQLFYCGPLDRMYADFWKANAGTRTGVEFLHVLAGHYDFEKRALHYLFDAFDEAKAALALKYYQRDLFRKKLKSYIVVEVHDRLMRRFRRMGFDHRDQVMARYVSEQEKIYRLILSLDDKHRGGALDGLARLYWGEGDKDRAIQLWKKIGNSYRDPTYRSIRHNLGAVTNRESMEKAVDRIISLRNRSGSEALLDRLVRFNRWAKRARKVKTDL